MSGRSTKAYNDRGLFVGILLGYCSYTVTFDLLFNKSIKTSSRTSPGKSRHRITKMTTKTFTQINRKSQHLHLIENKTMNSISIQLNNSAVDALYAGHLFKGFKILSRAFLDAARRRHRMHTMASSDSESALRFSLKDCAATLTSYLRTSHSSIEGTQRFLCLKFLRIEIKPVDESADQLCSCAVTWALGYK
jgi:hypothetical protein